VQPDTLLLRSPNAPYTPLTQQEYGFTDQSLRGESWRVFSLPDDSSPMVVQVGERHEVREALIHSIALRTMMPILVALPLLAVVIWIGVGRALLPLTKLAKQVENRAPSYLQPIESYGVPAEAKSLVASLNDLFGRLERAFDSERRFTSDAAHELRTPLAGLKTQAQVVLRSANEQNRQRAVRQLELGVDRATHLVQQLLTLARLDPDHGLTESSPVRLDDLLRLAHRDLTPVAQDKNIELRLGSIFTHEISGHADAISILLRNLIDNAIRYTPANGLVEVSMVRDANTVAMRVADSGPGIPAEEREMVFKRFYRRLGTEAPGSGLGLSIVQRIAELHRAQIALNTSPHGGLQVDVIFHAPESAGN
jgi:two-component system sensor histidine kinase QseC